MKPDRHCKLQPGEQQGIHALSPLLCESMICMVVTVRPDGNVTVRRKLMGEILQRAAGQNLAEFLLSLAPYGMNRTPRNPMAGFRRCEAGVHAERSVRCLDHIEEGDFPGRPGERNPAAVAARCLQQSAPGKLADDLPEKRFGDLPCAGYFRHECDGVRRERCKVQHRPHRVFTGHGQLKHGWSENCDFKPCAKQDHSCLICLSLFLLCFPVFSLYDAQLLPYWITDIGKTPGPGFPRMRIPVMLTIPRNIHYYVTLYG